MTVTYVLTRSQLGGALVKTGVSAIVKHAPKAIPKLTTGAAGKGVNAVVKHAPKAVPQLTAGAAGKGVNAVVKHAPKAVPQLTAGAAGKGVSAIGQHAPKAVPQLTSVAAGKSAGLLTKYPFLKFWSKENIKHFLLYAAADFSVDQIMAKLGKDNSEGVAVDGENAGTAESDPSVVTAESASNVGPINGAAVAGGAPQSDVSQNPSSEPESSVAGDLNSDELTLEELDQIQAGINQREQSLGDSPDPNLNPFFEGETPSTL